MLFSISYKLRYSCWQKRLSGVSKSGYRHYILVCCKNIGDECCFTSYPIQNEFHDRLIFRDQRPFFCCCWHILESVFNTILNALVLWSSTDAEISKQYRFGTAYCLKKSSNYFMDFIIQDTYVVHWPEYSITQFHTYELKKSKLKFSYFLNMQLFYLVCVSQKA